ncbi:MAG: hypothetical protein V3T22_10415 [Planctomycetota bacterium]
MTTESIKFSGAGGVPDIEIPVSREGGLYIIEGANGSGKSQLLQGIDDLTTGERSMRVKHGRRAGSIEGFGVSIHLGGRTTRRGELDVIGLDGRMDVAAIVDPGFKQRDAANRAVVKSLCRMAGLEPDASRFHHLAPGDDEEACKQAFTEMFPTLESDDLVELARKVKDGFDAKARILAGEAERAMGEADALLATGGDLDLEQESDDGALQKALELAIGKQAAVKQRAVTYGDLERAAVKARALIGTDGGPTPERMEAAEQAIVEASGAIDAVTTALKVVDDDQRAAHVEVERLQALRERVENEVLMCHEALATKQLALTALQKSEEGFVAAHVALEAIEEAEAPTDQEMVDASQSVLTARTAHGAGVLVRDALARHEQGGEKRLEAHKLAGREQELREAGRATDGVLSEMINEAGVVGMSVVDGEVFAQLPDEDAPRPFLDMSDGERTRAALLATIPVVEKAVPEGERGVIVLGQRVYQDLDFQNRKQLAEFVKDLGVIVFTALPTDGELRAVKAES